MENFELSKVCENHKDRSEIKMYWNIHLERHVHLKNSKLRWWQHIVTERSGRFMVCQLDTQLQTTKERSCIVHCCSQLWMLQSVGKIIRCKSEQTYEKVVRRGAAMEWLCSIHESGQCLVLSKPAQCELKNSHWPWLQPHSSKMAQKSDKDLALGVTMLRYRVTWG